MYHVELRQFPHNHTHFNLTERQLRAITEPWVRGEPLEIGERKWSPHEARLTVFEGPEIPLDQLSIGRGWRTAQRHGQDVSRRVIAQATRDAEEAAAAATGAAATGGAAGAGAGALADPLALGVQLASLLGADPAGLLAAWREVAAANPALAPSDSLALAERRIAAAGDQG